jgi:aminoglycoside 3-N-acetyltransferase I
VSSPRDVQIRQLGASDVHLCEELLTVFGEAFDQVDTYGQNRPDAAYLQQLLGGDTFIALVAMCNERVVGGIAAYELRKFEQRRSEIYLYDLAVDVSHRRRGIASALIQELQHIAHARGAYVVFVQADLDDEPAIALYSKLGRREDVLHFDLDPRDGS